MQSQTFFCVRRYIQTFLFAVGIALCVVSPVYAVSDEFVVRTLIGGDTAPPSVPAGFDAVPVAQTQIDLSWSASSDDWALAGYRVWRDDINIATTTLTTYEDTGLTASTTYMYYVTAYDTSLNESASSTVVSATTLAVPVIVPPEPSGTQYGSRLKPIADMLVSFQIFPAKDSAKLLYETSGYVRSWVEWGRGESYELGSLLEEKYRKQHESYITELVPNTTYSFRVVGQDVQGRTGEMYRGTFTTLPPEDIFPPSNVKDLSAHFDGADVVLSWTNPDDEDFDSVRVVRSELFYPYDAVDGWLVYTGDDTSIRDVDMKNGKRHFYTVFTYDELGNMSSGAVIAIDSGTTTVEYIDETKNTQGLSFDDISFMQGGAVLAHEESGVGIDGSRQLTISIPYNRLPEHLKTILVRMKDARDGERTFEFLLRANAEKTLYTGTLAPFGVEGNFPISIAVFDYQTAQIGYTNGVLISHIRPIHTETGAGILWNNTWSVLLYTFSIMLLLALLLLIRRQLART